MNPRARLAEIAAAVAAARHALAAGAEVDITGLDAAVTEVCDAAKTLPPGERRPFADELSALADALDQLAADIMRRGDASRRQRATEAYGPEGSR